MVLFFPLLLIGIVAVYLGIEAVTTWIGRGVSGQPILLGLVGVGLILVSALAVGRVITGKATPDLTRRQLAGAGVVWLAIGLVGVLVVWTAVTNKPEAPAF
jgi:hypothetical protein